MCSTYNNFFLCTAKGFPRGRSCRLPNSPSRHLLDVGLMFNILNNKEHDLCQEPSVFVAILNMPLGAAPFWVALNCYLVVIKLNKSIFEIGKPKVTTGKHNNYNACPPAQPQKNTYIYACMRQINKQSHRQTPSSFLQKSIGTALKTKDARETTPAQQGNTIQIIHQHNKQELEKRNNHSIKYLVRRGSSLQPL